MTYQVTVTLEEDLPEDKEVVVFAPASTTILKKDGDQAIVYGWMENDIMIRERARDSDES